jgi:sugar (pentulose or hexulose) kinase
VRRPGDYNTTLGTTLVFKGISSNPCCHPQGLIYSHKLPGGYWLPGAASNTGGEWIEAFFRGADLKLLDAQAAALLPVACLVYPLARQGERFPFLAPEAEGFRVSEPADQTELYAACLQGTALVERLAYQVLDQTAGVSGGQVYSTGGGSSSQVWMQCRADATGRVLHRPACSESAFGSAVLAAAGFRNTVVWQVVEEMVRQEHSFAPDPSKAAMYEDLSVRFAAELAKRGYG